MDVVLKRSSPQRTEAWHGLSRQTPRLRLAPAASAERRVALEQFIRRRFAERYGADVRHFMPCLFGIESPDGELHGAVGCRSAGGTPLFLERYLPMRIEHAIRVHCGARVARAEIVEVGNLATRGPATARYLIVELTGLLAAQGFRWVAFTGTTSLLNSFTRLGLAPMAIAPADPSRLGDERDDWGSYYDNEPQVMVGEIRQGRHLLQRGDGACLAAPSSGSSDRSLRSPIEGALHAACP